MIITANIHEGWRKVDIWFAYCDGEFACLSSLLFALYGGSRSFGIDCFEEFYGGGKLVEL